METLFDSRFFFNSGSQVGYGYRYCRYFNHGYSRIRCDSVFRALSEEGVGMRMERRGLLHPKYFRTSHSSFRFFVRDSVT